MTPLRQQMIRAMDLKNLSPHTRRSYLNAVTKLAKHYRQSPETITEEMIEDYLLYLKNEKGQRACNMLHNFNRPAVFLQTHFRPADIHWFQSAKNAAQTSQRAHQTAGRQNHLCPGQPETPADPDDPPTRQD